MARADTATGSVRQSLRAKACPLCGGAVTVERGGLRAHTTCLRCGHVDSRQERSMSLAQASLRFMAWG
jgi:reverse gyrase